MLEELVAGDSVGLYLIEEEIGRGGMGVVYRCKDPKLNRQVALKVMAPQMSADPDVRKRFLREATIIASIDHPNVVPIYDSGESDGRLYLAMRYVEGTNVQDLIQDCGPIEPHRAASIIEQVASALDAAHDRGLVHRDVKPANILLTQLREREHAYLTDFGLAALSDASTRLTRIGQAVGSIDYLAPEQIESGTVDARTDTYALGCVAFQMLTGQIPFAKDSDIAKLWGHVNEAPPSASAIDPELSPGVDAVLARAMSKSPDDRYSASGEFSRPLSDALGLAGAEAGPSAPIPPDTSATPVGSAGDGSQLAETGTGPAKRGSRFALFAAAIVVAVLGCALGAYFVISGRNAGSAPVVAGPPTPSASASAAPSDDAGRADFTPVYAAAMLNIYLRAIGSADIEQICALNASRAPGNPNVISSSQCNDRYKQAIVSETAYWQPGQPQQWAGMSAQADRAVVNDKGNFVFDSREGGFTFGSGKPADCASADGCWFVVLHDRGDVYVERGPTPANATNPI